MKSKDLPKLLIAQIVIAGLTLTFIGLISAEVSRLRDSMVQVQDSTIYVEEELREIRSHQSSASLNQLYRIDDLESQLLKSTTAIIQRCELPERKE